MNAPDISRRGALGGVAAGLTVGAVAASSSPAAAATTSGSVDLDSFAGATDDDKLTAALAYLQVQTRIPWLRLPGRDLTFSLTRALFSGLKIAGAGVPVGPKNLEISSGKLVAARVKLNVGNGAASWLVGSGSVYDVCLAGVAFQAGNPAAQLLDQATGSLYACEFSNLNIYGFKYAFGNPTRKCLITQVLFTGHWTVLGFSDTQFTLGGSDCSLWEGGYLNIGGPSGHGGGMYQLILDSLEKTSVGNIYVTSRSGWRGVWVRGNCARLNLFGGEFEGQNAGDPCAGSAIRIDGGKVAIYGPWLAYSMAAPTAGENGVVQVNGGDVLIDRPVYNRGNTPATTPMVSVDGGTCYVRAAASDTADTPVVHKGAGTVIADASVKVS